MIKKIISRHGVVTTTIALTLLCIIVSELITGVSWYLAGLPNLHFVLFIAFLCPAFIAPTIIISLCRLTENLQKSEEKYSHSLDLMHYVISHARSAIAVHDKDLNYIYVSDRYLKEYKVKDQNIIGKHHYEVFPDLPQKWREVHQRCLNGEVLSAEEDPYFRDDGSADWTRWECRPWYEPDGSVGGIIVYTEVITERKRAEEELRRSREQVQLAVEGSDLGLWDWNIKTGETFFSDKYFSMLGYSPTDHPQPNEAWEKLLHPDDKNHVFRVLEESLKNDLSWNLEFRLLAKNGDYKWILGRGKVVERDKEGGPVRATGTHLDISEHKRAETEKKELEAQLRQSHKMEAVGTLAGGIAHDFNNILGIIMGNADMARANIPASNQAMHNIDQVLIASYRAKDLVRQILSFSRQDAIKKESYYLCRLVDESIKSLRSTIPASVTMKINIPVKCQDSITDCSKVLANPSQVHQLLLNLCVNAVQAMEEKGFLEISIHEVTVEDELPDRLGLKPGGYVYLSVADTGHGMSQEIIEQIFDPFFTTKEVDKGTGIGLSVVHGIIKSHDAKIFVESELGKGSTFHIYFPITEENTSEKNREETGLLPTGNERILIIDDEEMLVNMEKEMVERQGYSVTAKTDSVEALELFKSNPTQFDLVITDQTMPNMNGAELAEILLELNPALPIILCTGYSSKIDKEKARQIGISDFASKPLNRRDIAKLIRKVLDKGPRLVEHN